MKVINEIVLFLGYVTTIVGYKLGRLLGLTKHPAKFDTAVFDSIDGFRSED